MEAEPQTYREAWRWVYSSRPGFVFQQRTSCHHSVLTSEWIESNGIHGLEANLKSGSVSVHNNLIQAWRSYMFRCDHWLNVQRVAVLDKEKCVSFSAAQLELWPRSWVKPLLGHLNSSVNRCRKTLFILCCGGTGPVNTKLWPSLFNCVWKEALSWKMLTLTNLNDYVVTAAMIKNIQQKWRWNLWGFSQQTVNHSYQTYCSFIVFVLPACAHSNFECTQRTTTITTLLIQWFALMKRILWEYSSAQKTTTTTTTTRMKLRFPRKSGLSPWMWNVAARQQRPCGGGTMSVHA